MMEKDEKEEIDRQIDNGQADRVAMSKQINVIWEPEFSLREEIMEERWEKTEVPVNTHDFYFFVYFLALLKEKP